MGLGGAGGEGFVEFAEAAGHVAGEVEEDDGVLFGHLLEEVAESGGFDFDGADGVDGADGGGAEDGVDEAHFAEEVAVMKRGEGDGAWRACVFDDFDGAFDEDEEGVAFVAFADDPGPGGKVVNETFAGEECLGGEVDSGEDRRVGEGFEEFGGRGDHPRKRVTEFCWGRQGNFWEEWGE